MGKPVLLQQYVKRIIAVSDAAWVAKRRCCQGENIIAYLSFRTDVRNLKNGEQRFLVASLRRNDRESRSLAQLQAMRFAVMVTIEPIMEFDHTALVEMLKKIKPFQVNIGCNTNREIKLPETTRDQIVYPLCKS